MNPPSKAPGRFARGQNFLPALKEASGLLRVYDVEYIEHFAE